MSLHIFDTFVFSCACMQSHFSHVQLFATPCAVALQAPLSMGFSRQEHWSRLPFPSPGGLPNQGTEPTSLMSPAFAGGFFYHQHHLGSPLYTHNVCTKEYFCSFDMRRLFL